ncbi:hypothetical protein F0562_001842 [Nyssa sinensis]|uniref:Uncharacterized protein n=1 Tax=Nyssa sinensis TaxID=561372 RepID=A0A5J5C851_9ASTE|nr:hypothetical protein F0562_001842 [Nyssa sinensis]
MCATGWFSSHVLDSLRLRVAVRFLSVYPNTGAEALLRSATERFEKSKKIQICTKDLRLDEEGQRRVNRELVGNGDADDEDEEDEIEDDDVEEELDAYEALDLAGEDGDFSPQPCLYSENISKNYLQELFDCNLGGTKAEFESNWQWFCTDSVILYSCALQTKSLGGSSCTY